MKSQTVVPSATRLVPASVKPVVSNNTNELRTCVSQGVSDRRVCAWFQHPYRQAIEARSLGANARGRNGRNPGRGAGRYRRHLWARLPTGDTFTNGIDGKLELAMTSIHVPAPVIALSVKPVDNLSQVNLTKALQRFTKEDPSFKAGADPDSGETVIHAMGELQLEVHIERMKREYNVEVEVSPPQVAYRETVRSLQRRHRCRDFPRAGRNACDGAASQGSR